MEFSNQHVLFSSLRIPSSICFTAPFGEEDSLLIFKVVGVLFLHFFAMLTWNP